ARLSFPARFRPCGFLLPVPSEGGSGFLRGHSRLSLFPPLSVIPAFAGMTAAGVSVFSDRFLPRLGSGFPLSRE
ncbi:TPA: hypothetical protein ACLAW5_002231, partial [Neisseria meningitidis]